MSKTDKRDINAVDLISVNLFFLSLAVFYVSKSII